MSYQNQLLGTIISSVLDYDNLCKITGDNIVINPRTSTYIPCDGRAIPGSLLEQKTKMHNVPDLRGRFLRGLNTIYNIGQPPFDIHRADEDGEHRIVGEYQGDEVKKHGHTAHSSGGVAITQSGMGIQSDEGQQVQFGKPSISVDDYNGKESRPRNISVNFYIKIN